MTFAEAILCFGVCAAALMPLLYGRGRNWVLAAVAIAAGLGAAGILFPRASRIPGNADGLPETVADTPGQEYVSSNSCRSCHPGEYASWHKTYHRTMTQLATAKSVVAPFDNVRLESRGRQYQLETRDEDFWIRMPDPDWEHLAQRSGTDLSKDSDPPLVERRIFMTTGSHHMQGYWVKSQYGNLVRQVPWYYLIEERRWVPREDVFMEPPGGKRHFMTWNDQCIQCHSVGGKPGLDLVTGSGIPDTEVAEFGIACESCHGPAAEHVAKHRNPWSRYSARRESGHDDTIVNPARLSSHRASEICGSCHSFSWFRKPREYVVEGSPFRPGEELQQTMELVQHTPDLKGIPADIFWNDGTCRTGGDEFNGLAASGCYQQGEISCLSCHSLHRSDPNDQLAAGMDGNQACVQCHSKQGERLKEHTHHRAGSSGSLCYNCHMPHTSYALLTAMRSHQIDSPRIDAGNSKRPNACNLCHLDKTLDWTAGTLTQWYGVPRVELTGDRKNVAASLLWLYRGDALQRAIAGWSLGWKPAQEASGTDWIAPHLAELLDDPYAAVRFIGHRSLKSLPGFENLAYDYIGPSRQRTESKRRVQSQWVTQGAVKSREGLSRILLSRPDRLDETAVEHLLRERDHTPVEVAE